MTHGSFLHLHTPKRELRHNVTLDGHCQQKRRNYYVWGRELPPSLRLGHLEVPVATRSKSSTEIMKLNAAVPPICVARFRSFQAIVRQVWDELAPLGRCEREVDGWHGDDTGPHQAASNLPASYCIPACADTSLSIASERRFRSAVTICGMLLSPDRSARVN